MSNKRQAVRFLDTEQGDRPSCLMTSGEGRTIIPDICHWCTETLHTVENGRQKKVPEPRSPYRNETKKETSLFLEHLNSAVDPPFPLPADHGFAGVEVPEITFRELILFALLALARRTVGPRITSVSLEGRPDCLAEILSMPQVEVGYEVRSGVTADGHDE